jgi:spore maturation protein SpmB
MKREALTREMAYEVGRYGQAGVAPAGTVLPCFITMALAALIAAFVVAAFTR